MTDRNDPTKARIFDSDDHRVVAEIDAGSPTMIKLPAGLARDIAENMQAFATYNEGVAALCSTEAGRARAEQTAKALRSYARGLLEHAIPGEM